MNRHVTWKKHGNAWAEIWIDGTYVGTISAIEEHGKRTGQCQYYYAADNHYGRRLNTGQEALQAMLRYHERWLKRPVLKRLVPNERDGRWEVVTA